MKLTNTWKHFGVMLAIGLLAWLFAYIGKAQGLGYFPNVAAFMITIWVEYRQWSRSGRNESKMRQHRIHQLQAEQNQLIDILSRIHEDEVLNRMSLESRLEKVKEELGSIKTGFPFMTLPKQRGLDSFVDILAGNAGFWLGYNVMLKLTAGGWIV